MSPSASPSASPSTGPIRRFAPAKLNLSLKIVGRRPDGYHLLDSLVAFADIGDWVTARPADGLTLTLAGPRAGDLAGIEPQRNLVLRAAEALRRACGVEAGAALTLEKHLPAAGGVGGGSSDAAAALRALIALWGVRPDAATLQALALDLGADLPVCLAAAPTRMRGIGEVLSPLGPIAPAGVVLINPGVPTPTGAVFTALAGRFSAPASVHPPGPLGPDPRDLAAAVVALGNDLAAPAVECTPAVGAVLAALRADPDCLCAAMSGSGATCFALTRDRARADAAAARLAEGAPADWWIAAGGLFAGELDA